MGRRVKNMDKDYYQILGVNKTASAEEIKTAFRKKAHEHHPDKGGDQEKFKELNEAYQVLGNAEKRQRYDQFGSAAFSGGGAGGGWSGFSGQGFGNWQGGINVDLDDLFGGFGDIFGFGGRSEGSRSVKRRGRDIEMMLTLDFQEAVFGAEKELEFSKNVTCAHCQGAGAEPNTKVETCATCQGTGQVSKLQRTILGNIKSQSVCPTCQGEGQTYEQKCKRCAGLGITQDKVKLKVRIPAGIDTGESIRLSGQGEAGMKGGAAGDLYLRIKVKADRQFTREGYNIHTEQKISITQAILGDKIDLETIHGQVKLKIPAGTQAETVFKVRGKGISKLHSSDQGDHYVKIKVAIPSKLNKKQQQLLKELNI